jgi:hypothetical protein
MNCYDRTVNLFIEGVLLSNQSCQELNRKFFRVKYFLLILSVSLAVGDTVEKLEQILKTKSYVEGKAQKNRLQSCRLVCVSFTLIKIHWVECIKSTLCVLILPQINVWHSP